MNRNTLLLTALGVVVCSGFTTEQRLERLGARIKADAQGEIVMVSFVGKQIIDAGVPKLMEALPKCDMHR